MAKKRSSVLSQPSVETRLERFLFRDQKRQMVTGEFVTYRNVGRDANVVKLVNELQEKTGRDDGMFMLYYATRKVYTVNLTFDWHPETPDYFKSLETYWNMVVNGEPEDELYLFYIEKLHNVVGNEWTTALDTAQKIWKPPQEGWLDEVDENGETSDDVDPN